jgi:hypothetical protein
LRYEGALLSRQSARGELDQTEEKYENRERYTKSNHFAELRMLCVHDDVDNPTSAGGMLLVEGGGAAGAEVAPGTMLPARLRGTS